MTVQDGLAAVAASCVDRVRTTCERTRRRFSVENLHNLRVNARRLRAVLQIFRGHIRGRERRRLSSDLRWLRRKTGPARDWDVLIGETLPGLARQPPVLNLAPVARSAVHARAKARRRLRARLEGHPCARLLSRLKSFSKECRRQPGEGADVLFTEAASSALQERHQALCRHARSADLRDTESLHRLRARVRMLRYMAAVLETVYAGKSQDRYVSTLRRIQAELGAVHDLQVARELIAGLELPTTAERLRGLLEQRLAARTSGRRAALKKPSRAVAGLQPFWTREGARIPRTGRLTQVNGNERATP